MVVRPDVAQGPHHDTASSKVSVMHGHGVAYLMHRKCARASLLRQGLNAQVERAQQGLRQDADVAVGEMAVWEARLLQQGCTWVSMHDAAAMRR